MVEAVGGTPLIEVPGPAGTRVWAKAELLNPTGSVKDRPAVAMIEAAERAGDLRPGGTVIEPTSGNTGIALAMVAAEKGYRLILTMPETMSLERRKMLAALGAELILTPGGEGMKGAISRARDLLASIPGAFIPDQFSNPANPEAHYRGTGPEIVAQAGGKVDAFVAGVGTGGTLTGVGRALREVWPDVELIAVEPRESPVISGGKPGPHRIQGIGAGFIPPNLDPDLLTGVSPVTGDEATAAARWAARRRGILAGISSGANLHAAWAAAERLGPEAIVVTVLCDSGQRYLSGDLFTV
ncbi:MAG TPA: cysteine synthase A [bacterium]|nr:cysteine synthase A [bacterium]HPQ66948.1 cysteine synthase A [bacterium]